MPSSVTITRNFGPLTDIRALTREDFAVIGRLAREQVIRRTQAGRDENDQAFAPYSPAYAEAKGEAGAGSAVNLTVSGEMLRGIVVETPTDTGVTLSFGA